MNTHGNCVWNTKVWVRVPGVDPARDSNWGLAPLFHITGLIAHVCRLYQEGLPLVLMYRFAPGLAASMCGEFGCTFT